MNIKTETNKGGKKMMLPFSSFLILLSGMLLMDTILCVLFMKKTSEGLLELVVTILVFVIAKLLEANPVDKLNEKIFVYLAAGTVLISLCVMFYHLFWRIIPSSPHRNDKKHSKNPAKKEREE